MGALGKRIRALRERNNVSQTDLAAILNVANSTLSQYETGQRVPSDEIKVKIAKYFSVSVDYLLGNTDTPNVVDSDGKQYVIDDEAMEYLEEIHKRPEMKILFSVSKKASKQDIETAVTLIEALKQKADPQTKE